MFDADPELEVRRSRILTGNLRATVFWLALPVLCEQLLNFLVGFVDTLLSGHLGETTSADATSAVGLSAYIGWLASLLFSLVGAGTTALVSRSWGAGEFDEANRIANRSLTLATAMALLMYILFYALAPVLAALFHMSPDVTAMTVRYLRLDAIGLLPMGLSLVGAAALHGTGDTRSPMWIFGFVSVLNVITSCGLAYGVGPFPRWGIDFVLVRPIGIDGIVTGTLIARFAGVALLLAGLIRGLSGLKIVWRELTIRGEAVRRILRIGTPAAIDGVVTWIGHFLFLLIIGRLGGAELNSALLAAHVIGVRVEAITYLPAAAWGLAAAAIVGQSLGAQNPARALEAGNEALKQCIALGLVITFVFFFGAEKIYQTMHDDPAVWAAGVLPFRILAFFQVPHFAYIVYLMSLRGAGDTRYPLFVSAVAMFGFRLPIAYVCGIVLHGGLLGAWAGMFADMAVRGVLATIRYHRGKWLKTAV